MDEYLRGENAFPFITSLMDEQWVAYVTSYSGMLFDLLILPLILWPVTRWYALGAAVVFHLLNSIIFNVEFFPWLAIAATLLFLTPAWPRLGRQWSRLSSIEPDSNGSGRSSSHGNVVSRTRKSLSTGQKAVTSLLALYFLVQVILPLRHFAYPGNTDWTGEGALFAWRMLIARQTAQVEFFVREEATGQQCEVPLGNYLAAFQVRRLAEQPDMMVQFAHIMADEYGKAGRDVEIYVRSEMSLNGRPASPLIDPELNLAAEKRSLSASWIEPIGRSLPPPSNLPPCKLLPRFG